MPRRKPASGKQHKAELRLKRAIKRGDVPPDAAPTPKASRGRFKPGRGGGSSERDPLDQRHVTSRQLQSSFVKLSARFLEEIRDKAATIALPRPIPAQNVIYDEGYDESSDAIGNLTIMRRPKWNYEMSKKQVEANEEGMFKKWLDETDNLLERWTKLQNELKVSEDASSPGLMTHGEIEHHPSDVSSHSGDGESDTRMPIAIPMYERNLEVWRQLWRVTEICEILLVLLDARCPLLHFPPSLQKYLANSRPTRKIIFVLTKTDICGAIRTDMWTSFLSLKFPGIRIVRVEAYKERIARSGQGKRKQFEPYIPSELRKDLVEALMDAHAELCTPPLSIQEHKEKLASWLPHVKQSIDWDVVLRAGDEEVSFGKTVTAIHDDVDDGMEDGDDHIPHDDFLSIGLIGQPNVGKSSLLNALFGVHKVKASKTPGKTKHFQTLFWTKDIRLVDCPGLVFPNYISLEKQVLSGVLPVSQVSAVPSCIYYAALHLPLETILRLHHPLGNGEAAMEDKRTWRVTTRRDTKPKGRKWTAMDILTAFAEDKGWITAKAGRPDINRAGNSILRALAEGRIKWAFCPPSVNSSFEFKLAELEGSGIYVETVDQDMEQNWSDDAASDDDDLDSFSDSSTVDDTADSSAESDSGVRSRRVVVGSGTGMFAALSIDDDEIMSEGEAAGGGSEDNAKGE